MPVSDEMREAMKSVLWGVIMGQNAPPPEGEEWTAALDKYANAALATVYPAIRAEVLKEAMVQAELIENANVATANQRGADAPGAMYCAAGAAAVKTALRDLLALQEDTDR